MGGGFVICHCSWDVCDKHSLPPHAYPPTVIVLTKSKGTTKLEGPHTNETKAQTISVRHQVFIVADVDHHLVVVSLQLKLKKPSQRSEVRKAL